MLRLVLLAAAALLLATPAQVRAAATADTGTELLSLCQAARSGGESAQGVKCTAYLIGLFDGLRTFSMNSRDPLICPPARIDDEQFAAAYVNWAQSNAHRMREYPVGGALEALIQAFPCRREPPPPPPPSDQRRR